MIVTELRSHTNVDGSRLVIDKDADNDAGPYMVTRLTPSNKIIESKSYDTEAEANKEFERFI